MVRPDVARARVSRAVVWLTDASSIVERPASEFVAATKDRDLAIFYLFLNHSGVHGPRGALGGRRWLGPPDDAGSTFDVLAERGAIDRGVADTLR